MNDDSHDNQPGASAPDPGDEIFFRTEAAEYLTEKRKVKTSPKSLGKYACIGGGPSYRRFGQRAGYTRRDLDAWADGKITGLQRSTSEASARRQRRADVSRTAPVEDERRGEQLDLEDAIASKTARIS